MYRLAQLFFLLPLTALAAPAPPASPSPYVGDLTGCGALYIPLTSAIHFVRSSDRVRSYHVHVPAEYNVSTPAPAVVGYHGSSSIGLFFAADTFLDLPIFTPSTLMIYPDGVNGSWAGPSYHTATSVAEDLQFTYDVLADVRSKYCVDSSRIYATGISNGGGFVGTLACNDTVGGEFAAFAPSSGSFYTDVGPTANHGCTPARDLTPIMEIHGGADESVNYDGGAGEGGEEPSIMEWLGFWSTRNACVQTPEQQDSFDADVHHYTWTCQGVVGAVQHWKVDDMKHDWASTEPNFSQLAADDKPTHISGSSLIMSFFAGFYRPAPQKGQGTKV